MKYGRFDDEACEYVIERPDTPRAWTNYLGDTRYGAIITNHGGGYSFYKSAAMGRILRFRTSAVPDGMPGRLFYLRDQETGAYWSATWQPVGNVEGFEGYECRHGTAYTTIQSVANQIKSEATYFVPLGQRFEVWRLRIVNQSDKPRSLRIMTFCEFTSEWDWWQDLINVQASAHISQVKWIDGPRAGDNKILDVSICDGLPRDPTSEDLRDGWMTLVGSPITGFDTERDAFLGPWGTYARPDAVVSGMLTGSLAYGDTVCGALGTDIELAPGESREVTVLLGVGEASKLAGNVVADYSDPEHVESELTKLKLHWHARLKSLNVRTPDPAFDSMVNVWGLYNSLVTFAWSRSASLVYNGDRDGLGYRDTVQDILGVVGAIPEEARERLELMLTGQVASGGAMPIVSQFKHNPGHETCPPDEEFRSDDCLWLFNTVPAWVAETGDVNFYFKVLPFADHGQATVLGHLRRALEFNLGRVGAHGLPCGLKADWNDCIRLGYHGESVFVTFQVRYGLGVYADISRSLGEIADAEWAIDQLKQLDVNIRRWTWDGNWFRWAIADDGAIYGTKDYPEGQVYINTQAWAVISGAATTSQAEGCMNVLDDRLATEYGIAMCDPPLVNSEFELMRAVRYNPGTKENGGIFNHPQSWAVIAECMLGHGDRAYEYHHAYMPSAQNDRAEIRQVEPYVHCQSAQSNASPKFGRSRLPWLTGAAAWTYYSATQWILGLRPELDGFRLDPCIPSEWDGFEANRVIRGNNVRVIVRNPNHVCKGIAILTVDGVTIDGPVIDWERLHDGSQIEAVMGNSSEENLPPVSFRSLATSMA